MSEDYHRVKIKPKSSMRTEGNLMDGSSPHSISDMSEPNSMEHSSYSRSSKHRHHRYGSGEERKVEDRRNWSNHSGTSFHPAKSPHYHKSSRRDKSEKPIKAVKHRERRHSSSDAQSVRDANKRDIKSSDNRRSHSRTPDSPEEGEIAECNVSKGQNESPGLKSAVSENKNREESDIPLQSPHPETQENGTLGETTQNEVEKGAVIDSKDADSEVHTENQIDEERSASEEGIILTPDQVEEEEGYLLTPEGTNAVSTPIGPAEEPKDAKMTEHSLSGKDDADGMLSVGSYSAGNGITQEKDIEMQKAQDGDKDMMQVDVEYEEDKKEGELLENGDGVHPTSSACKVRTSLVYGCSSVDIFIRLNKISEGTYGAVYRAMNKKTKEIVALKQVKYHSKLFAEGFPIASLREISIMLELNHPNVLNVQQVVVGDGQHHVFMVMEYIEHELKTIMEEKPEFTTAERKCLLKQLLEALAYMHENFVFHRDVKPSNLLYSNKGVLKVADFGMARKFGIPFGNKHYTREVVTLWYRPPEVILGEPVYTDKCDIWAVGAIFGELLKRRPLFAGHGEMDTLSKIFKLCGTPTEASWPGYSQLPHVRDKTFAKIPTMQSSWRETFPPASKHLTMGNGGVLSELGLDLLQRMLTPDPNQRLSAAEALEHPYFEEKPKPQAIDLMPSYPDTNNTAHRKRKKVNTVDLYEQKQQDTFRFGDRVDAEKFLSALDERTKERSAKRKV